MHTLNATKLNYKSTNRIRKLTPKYLQQECQMNSIEKLMKKELCKTGVTKPSDVLYLVQSLLQHALSLLEAIQTEHLPIL